MHINDVYALRTELVKVLCNEPVDRAVVRAVLAAANSEIAQFEAHLEVLAYREEAQL
jgi:hypothetical protein